mgnify:CR=1 FL=1
MDTIDIKSDEVGNIVKSTTILIPTIATSEITEIQQDTYTNTDTDTDTDTNTDIKSLLSEIKTEDLNLNEYISEIIKSQRMIESLKITLVKSVTLLQLLKIPEKEIESILIGLREDLLQTSTIVIEIIVETINPETNFWNRKISHKDIIIPKSLMIYLLQKSYVQNVNNHNNICLRIRKVIDTTMKMEECFKIHNEIKLIEEIVKFFVKEDEEILNLDPKICDLVYERIMCSS